MSKPLGVVCFIPGPEAPDKQLAPWPDCGWPRKAP
jgi:hypothetical protein